MSDIRGEIVEYIQDLAIINTHSHHLEDADFQLFSLDNLLTRSYVSWCGVPTGTAVPERGQYLDKVRYKSYFIWLQKSLQDLYSFEEAITVDNWEVISGKILEAHKDPHYHISILQQKCRYENIILDTYWQPGSNNGHPEVFSTTFRVDPLFYGYSKDSCDHNGVSPLKLYGVWSKDLEEYVTFIRDTIKFRKRNGCVALKCGLAYDRSLDFKETSKEAAMKAIQCSDAERTEQDVKAFQDYLFYRICAKLLPKRTYLSNVTRALVSSKVPMPCLCWKP